MAVRLEASIRRYIGLSTDTKPYVGMPSNGTTIAPNDLPPGSSFLESDTGKIFRFTGDEWQHAEPDDDVAQLLGAMLLELTKIRMMVEFETA